MERRLYLQYVTMNPIYIPFSSASFPISRMTMLQVRQRLLETGNAGPVAMIRTPLVDLPLGATEDRVCGTIDFERALVEGRQRGEGGSSAEMENP